LNHFNDSTIPRILEDEMKMENDLKVFFRFAFILSFLTKSKKKRIMGYSVGK